MNDTPPRDPAQPPGPEDSSRFEDLLAECIDLLASEGPEGLELLLAANPRQAPELRTRLATLQRLGMLGADEESSRSPEPIGPYHIERTLGHGGMSRVYLATHETSGEQVALKVLHTAWLDDERSRLRFEREVLAVSSLSHPCIVRVHDSGISGGQPWLAMEYVEGATLDHILAELQAAELPFEEMDGAHIRGIASRESELEAESVSSRGYVESVCRIVLDICAALEHAHAFGIVHRDVKPANIVVDPQGRAKLLDLGLATLEGSPSLTRTGDFAGTPYYVAPEQANAVHDADGRSDVFSLGVTLYEALTLKRPFEGRDAAEVFRNLQTRDPLPPGKLNSLLPRDLETICLQALEKKPARRYASMSEFATDLQRFLEFKPVTAKPISRARRVARLARRHSTWSLLILLATVAVIGTPIALILINDAIRQERDLARDNAREADRQAKIAQSVVDHLVELFSPPEEFSSDETEWSSEDMLKASVERIPGEFNEDPLLRAALLEAAGRIHSNLDRWDEAVPLLDRAYSLRQRQEGDGQAALAGTLVWLAQAHLGSRNPRAALSLASRGIAALENFDRPDYDRVSFDLRLTLAQAAHRAGDSEQGHDVLQALLNLCTNRPEEFAGRAVEVECAMAELLLDMQRGEEALVHGDQAVAQLREAWTPDVRRITEALRLRARIQEKLGEREAAHQTWREVQELATVFKEAGEGLEGDSWLEAYPFELLPEWNDEYVRAFQEGITALQTQRPQEAIAAFNRCLQFAPEHPVCLYNLACAHVLADDLDGAIDQLERASRQNFGTLQGNLDNLVEDPDLQPLQELPRFQDLRSAMNRAHRETLKRSRIPRGYLPEPGRNRDPQAFFVVFAGDQVAEGVDRFSYWREIAKACDTPLLYVEGLLAGQSSSWIAEIDNFLDDPWEVQQSPTATIRRFAADHGIRSGRAILIGEGSGAPVAFDLCLRAPGLFGAALLLDGLALASMEGRALAMARACDSRVQLLLGTEAEIPEALSDAPRSVVAQSLEQWLEEGGLWAQAELVEGRAVDLSVQRMTEEIQELWKGTEPAR